MKLIIDIDKDEYEILQRYRDIPPKENSLAMMIFNGTPIPDNATVCDIEQIRQEIEKKQKRFDDMLCHEHADICREILQIIGKYTK